ncbi:F-box protein SKIP17 [Apostasia shenzhenica]|uniref:F-box protein SKIP17 n=1 Tax=Apostasia shenzhenica TaxID=1088818 RepID=A0A2I0B0T2_9ASPA|nr:F-box protein SKIP17 [Apostasia shenzhenica]
MAALPSSSSSSPKRPYSGDSFLAGAARVSSERYPMDRVLESLLSLPDPSVSLDLSLERILDSAAAEVEKDQLIDSAMRVASAIVESAMRAARRRASIHNGSCWPLPSDLTVKVFSMLDTRSLCHVAAACSMFSKCAGDPLCYTNIDLTTKEPKINNAVVSTMIQRAGKNLQSLKLGIWPCQATTEELSQSLLYSSRNTIEASGIQSSVRKSRQWKESCMLTRSCLSGLSADGGFAGALLKRLHLYNIDKMDGFALSAALSVCKSLLDLEVLGICMELRQIFESVSRNCHSIKRLSIESSETGRDDTLKSLTCLDLVNGCPHIASLALKGFKLNDHKARILVRGLVNLNLVDFSTSYSITGTFLRNLGSSSNAQSLEVLILRDCLHLKVVEIARFLSAVISGDFRLLKHLDISNKDGLSAEEDWNIRCYSPSIPITRALEERPDLCILADFPLDGCDQETSSSSSLQIEDSQLFSPDYSSTSDSSYGSGLSSGNEDLYDGNYAFYDGDSIEDLEYQLIY